MIPAHEREHADRVTDALSSQPSAVQERWTRALDHLENARVYDAYLEFNELLKMRLGPTLQTHVQLQAVRCLRDAPVERSKTELALIDPQDAYQTVVLDYRLGWLMRHRLMSVAAALQYFDRVREEARRDQVAYEFPWFGSDHGHWQRLGEAEALCAIVTRSSAA